jgi:hypothetical protein
MSATAEAKAKFIAVCEEWADLLIDESAAQKSKGGVRWQFTPEQMMPIIDLPRAQREVWLAAYQLMLDAWDAAPAPEDV